MDPAVRSARLQRPAAEPVNKGRQPPAMRAAARWPGAFSWSQSWPVSLERERVVVDAEDPVVLGHWWADMLGWVVLNDSAEEFEIRPSADRLPGLIFAPYPKPGKQRTGCSWTSGPMTSRPSRPLPAGRGAPGGRRARTVDAVDRPGRP